MKVIFLDFDGVLNNSNNSEYHNMFSHNNFINLKKIIDNTDSYICLTTSHRNRELSLLLFEKVCTIFGINNRVIGKTDENSELSSINQNSILRVNEINDWLQNPSNKNLEKWVILDDMDMNINNFVRTNYKYGLTDDDANKAILILNN